MSYRDAWLYGNSRQRAAVRKAAVASKGLFDASSDVAYRHLVEDRRTARIVNWGGTSSRDVRVVKAAGADEPPPSRQLRDPFTTFYVQGVALEPPHPPHRLLNLTEENPFHSACLGAKATDACGRGWEFAPREGKESDKSLIKSEEPERLREMMEDLTPDLTFTELLFQAAWEMDAIGWGVWEAVRTSSDGTPGKHGDIGALYPIPSHTIRATLDPRKWVQIRAGRVRYFKKFGAECTINSETGEIYEWRGRGADRKRADELTQEYVASEIIIFKTYTPRSLWYGLPKWVSSIATVAELGAIREFNISWFASGGQVDYHMHLQAGSLDAAREMKEQVEQQIQEFAGRGHTNLFTAGDETTKVTVSKLGELLREGHFRFRRGDLVKEVLIAHQTPPYRIGWAETGSLGGNAAPEMLSAYKAGAIEPNQRVIMDRLRVTLFNPKIGIKTGDFRLKLAELDLTDLAAELANTRAGVEDAWLTPNQGREAMGLDPDDKHPELDEYYFRGQKLGTPPPAPPGMGVPGQPGAPGQPPGAPAEEKPLDGKDALAVLEGGKPKGEEPEVPKEKSAGESARDVVVEMLRGYEAKLKAALDESEVPVLPRVRPRARKFRAP
jgi:hypothetical protein